MSVFERGWQPDWAVFERPIDAARRLVSVDMGARHAEREAFPFRIALRIPMQAPREDGLRSESEAPALWALEDRITEAFESRGAFLLARILHRGTTELVYVAHVDADVGEVRTAVGDSAPYRVTVSITQDPSWSHARLELLPDEYAVQEVWNERLIEQRVKEHGDRLERTREIDHVALFADAESQAEAARILRERGFRVDEPTAPEGDDPHVLEFHRDERLDGDRPDAMTREILDVVLPLGGFYDGWGAMIEK